MNIMPGDGATLEIKPQKVQWQHGIRVIMAEATLTDGEQHVNVWVQIPVPEFGFPHRHEREHIRVE